MELFFFKTHLNIPHYLFRQGNQISPTPVISSSFAFTLAGHEGLGRGHHACPA